MSVVLAFNINLEAVKELVSSFLYLQLRLSNTLPGTLESLHTTPTLIPSLTLLLYTLRRRGQDIASVALKNMKTCTR